MNLCGMAQNRSRCIFFKRLRKKVSPAPQHMYLYSLLCDLTSGMRQMLFLHHLALPPPPPHTHFLGVEKLKEILKNHFFK